MDKIFYVNPVTNVKKSNSLTLTLLIYVETVIETMLIRHLMSYRRPESEK